MSVTMDSVKPSFEQSDLFLNLYILPCTSFVYTLVKTKKLYTESGKISWAQAR
jgi:hypothetical protein